MSEKLRSEITAIGLDPLIFNKKEGPVHPTYINFFFGNNGVGKTTIARAIKNGIGMTYASGKAKDDYLPLVFDQEYIDKCIKNYHNLPGVFTINEVNIEIQNQIAAKTKEQEDAR